MNIDTETTTISETEAPKTPRIAQFYICENYKFQGPRVVLLVGPAWRDAMKRHYGINKPSFFSRPARENEPDTTPNGHPWGWVYKPADALKDEIRWMDKEEFKKFEATLAESLGEIEAKNRDLTHFAQ